MVNIHMDYLLEIQRKIIMNIPNSLTIFAKVLNLTNIYLKPATHYYMQLPKDIFQ